ncbi:MAG: hypothetical protein CW346_13010 [Bacillaceae bacterium]|nr:hypothetical protein [Bacillaceae bacterium]
MPKIIMNKDEPLNIFIGQNGKKKNGQITDEKNMPFVRTGFLVNRERPMHNSPKIPIRNQNNSSPPNIHSETADQPKTIRIQE